MAPQDLTSGGRAEVRFRDPVVKHIKVTMGKTPLRLSIHNTLMGWVRHYLLNQIH